MTQTRLALLSIGLAGLAAAAYAAPQAIGINAAIRNQVMTRAATETALRPAVLKARVSLGDAVETARASVLQILLLDRTSFTVGSNARVTIDRFVYDPNRKASAVGASVARGAFRFLSGRSVHGMPGQTAIKTPVASIGVRGTMFEGVVGPDAVRIALGEAALANRSLKIDNQTATLVVLRGPGPAAGALRGAIDVTAYGQTVAVDSPGLAVFVAGPEQPPSAPFPLSNQGLLALHDLLRTTPDKGDGFAAIDPAANPLVDSIFECQPATIRNDQTVVSTC
jgi:hypothetical protein